MRKRRTIVSIVSLLAVLAVLFLIKDPWSTLGKEDRKLMLRDMDAVDRIVLADAYDSTELVRINGAWLLFGEEECNQTSVDNLLIAASRLRISSILSSGNNTEKADVPTESRRISWYKGDKVLLYFDFEVVSGKYLVSPPNSEISYYVEVSAYPDLKLEKVFSSISNHYRDHLIIDLLPSEISHIEIELPPEQSFGFVQDAEGHIRIETDQASGLPPDEKLNDLAIRLLFSYFTSIRFEEKSGIAADSLSGPGSEHSPMATIGVSSFSGEMHILRIYPYHESPGDEPHLFKALVVYNQESEALLVKYIYLDVLMRGLSHYLGDK